MPDRSPGITIHINAPQELQDKYSDDVIDPTITVNVDTQSFTYDSGSGRTFTGELSPDGFAAIGEVLLWTLKLRLTNRLDCDAAKDLSTVEIF
jgi:hypothetical protein